MFGLTLGFALILSGLFELHCAFHWKYFDRAYSAMTGYATWLENEGKDADLEKKGKYVSNLNCGGYLANNLFEYVTMALASVFAFPTLPFILPIWILSFLPRGLKKNRFWQVSDNLVCAVLFFAAATVLFVANTGNIRV